MNTAGVIAGMLKGLLIAACLFMAAGCVFPVQARPDSYYDRLPGFEQNDRRVGRAVGIPGE